MLYVIIAISASMAITSFAIDFGRVQLVKTQLRAAADAAARYACAGINDNTSAAKAIAAAANNSADGLDVTISASDVVKGYFNKTTRVFTANGTPTNSVQVTVGRTGNNGVPLVVGQTIGMPRVNVTAVTIAYFENGACAFTGLNSFDTGNNGWVGSYDSNVTTNPTELTSTGQASYGSNGPVTGNSVIDGNLELGPSGSNAGVTFTSGGSAIKMGTNIPAPADPAWTPVGNPGGIPQSYTSSGTVTLTGGTYWLTSLTVGGNVSFSGAATIYVNGNVSFNQNSSLTAYQDRPGNLRIYQIGANRTFGGNNNTGTYLSAVVTAPNADFTAQNDVRWKGAGMFKTMQFKNNSHLFYDTSLGIANGVPRIYLVK